MTQSARHHAHEHLVLLGLVEIQLDDLPGIAGRSDDRCFGLHDVPPSSAAPAPTGCGASIPKKRNVLCQVMSSSASGSSPSERSVRAHGCSRSIAGKSDPTSTRR